jgi:hypothetical protein
MNYCHYKVIPRDGGRVKRGLAPRYVNYPKGDKRCFRAYQRGKEMNNGEILAELMLDILPESIRENGKGREYFEKRMLEEWFPDLTEDEKVLVRSLTKVVLDRAFPR